MDKQIPFLTIILFRIHIGLKSLECQCQNCQARLTFIFPALRFQIVVNSHLVL